MIRERLDRLGFIDGDAGGFATGHVPHIAPHAYLCRWYAGLDDERLKAVEAESGRYVPESYRELLSQLNGGDLMGIGLNGFTGGLLERSIENQVGQPISVRYQNAVERPNYISEGHFGIGAINGEWSSQGHLYIASTGEVELYNARFDLIGTRWSSLQEFLSEEVTRRLSLYDERGEQIVGCQLLPGDTGNWEAMAQQADKEREGRQGILSRLLKANWRR